MLSFDLRPQPGFSLQAWTRVKGQGQLTDVVVVERLNQDVSGTATTWQGQSIDGEITRYAYDDVGNLDRIDQPNGVISDYVYDRLNRLDDLFHYLPDGNNQNLSDNPVLSRFDYGLNADGKRSYEFEYNGAGQVRRIDWAYDELGRLKEERHDVTAGGTAEDFTARYSFDLGSNRRKKTVDKANNESIEETFDYVYDASDRLLTEVKDSSTNTEDRFTRYEYSKPSTPGVNNWTVLTAKRVYDNLTGTGSPSETHEYQYNNQGQMSQSVVAKSSGTTTTTYKYNDDRIRVSQTEGTTTTIFHVDPNNHTGYAQVLEEGVDDSSDGKLQSNEVDKSYALGHDVLAEATSATAALFFLYDGHGSTRMLVTPASPTVTVHQLYAYDAYGNQLAGTGLTGADAATTRLLYSGERTDKTGLQYLRERYYNPGSGRFTTLDPFAGNQQDPLSLHKYLYVHANPILGIDPSGRSLSVQIAVSGISSSLASLSLDAIVAATTSAEFNLGKSLTNAAINGTIGIVVGPLAGTYFGPAITKLTGVIGKLPSLGGVGPFFVKMLLSPTGMREGLAFSRALVGTTAAWIQAESNGDSPSKEQLLVLFTANYLIARVGGPAEGAINSKRITSFGDSIVDAAIQERRKFWDWVFETAFDRGVPRILESAHRYDAYLAYKQAVGLIVGSETIIATAISTADELFSASLTEGIL